MVTGLHVFQLNADRTKQNAPFAARPLAEQKGALETNETKY